VTRGKRAALVLALGALLLASGVLIARYARPTEQSARRPLALITSLPLLFGEQFGLDTPRPLAMARIERAYAITPLALADAASLRGITHLLMAHPRAQPAEVLVDLDAWVRDGGQLVLLADPRLKWEGSRPLGDPLRPPPDFADTGLLAHWGLRLGVDEAGEGTLRATSPDCTIAQAGLVAECRLGRGTARIIADADFMLGQDDQARRRVDLLLDQLSAGDSR
jgi:hypothetical protein